MRNRPPLNFKQLRELIPLWEVVRKLGWRPLYQASDHLRGPCPIHRSGSAKSRSFSVGHQLCQCFKCHWTGDAVGLWGRLKMLPPYEAALDLCREFGVQPPLLPRG